MKRKVLSDKGVRALKARAKPYVTPDPELRGHWIRVNASGSKAFITVTRTPAGKQVWTTIGACDAMSIEAARNQARAVLQRVRAGLPAVETAGESFAAVAANWLKRHAKGLRTEREIRRMLERLVMPRWGAREFLSIRRSDVAALLDQVEDGHGKRTADKTLAIVRSLMTWYATRSDDYVPPVVKGMARQSPSETARARVLSDAELRALWQAAEAAGTFGAMVRMLLLTGQRLAKVQRMQWSELDGAEWTIPKEPREKENAGMLVLPALARAIIAAQPQLGDNPHVFAGRTAAGPFNGYRKAKPRLDRMSGISGWTLHDLRRTARSLMSRARVTPDDAERTLGHAIGGIRGIYDRHAFKDEKADALRRLAALIEGIVHPHAANIVPLAKPGT
jgi:integrase